MSEFMEILETTARQHGMNVDQCNKVDIADGVECVLVNGKMVFSTYLERIGSEDEIIDRIEAKLKACL